MKHGGDPESLYPNEKDLIDLSTGINPWGYPWLEKIDRDHLMKASEKLPTQKDYNSCVQAYADYLGAEVDHLTLSAGSQNLIEQLPNLFKPSKVNIISPTYSEHEICWRNAGHNVKLINNLDAVEQGSIVIFCAPNNPDGAYPESQKLINSHCKKGGYVIVDEAFADVKPERSLIGTDLPDNVIILRSFGKFFGLAGVRLGAAYTEGAVKIPNGLWDISALSLIIGATALKDAEWINETRKKLKTEMEKLTTMFQGKGYEVIGQTDLFCLIQGIDPSHILQHGIFARSFEERPNIMRFGLPPTEQKFQLLKDIV